MGTFWNAFAPFIAAIVIALIRASRAGAAQVDYCAIFAGVIVGLMLAPIPGTAGLIAITLVRVLCEWEFYSLACEARIQPTNARLSWRFSASATARSG